MEQPTQQNETVIGPMMLQQGRLLALQHLGHEPRMLLLFLDEQIDALLVNRASSGGRLLAQMRAFPAFANLKTLQRADQRLPHVKRNTQVLRPRNVPAVCFVPFEVFQPLSHSIPFGCVYFVPQSN